MAGTLNRSMTFDLKVDNDKDGIIHRKVVNSIRLYRSVCRKVYSMTAMARIAIADIRITKGGYVKVEDNQTTDLKLLSEAFGANPSRQINLQEFCPTALAFFWASAIGDVTSRWRSRDPEFAGVPRSVLTLNGIRDLAWFNHIGIGMPRLTARPDLYEKSISVKWDHEIGKVDFSFPKKLDSSRYWIWKNLRDNNEEWGLGTIYLNEDEGKLKMTISYSIPEKEKKLNLDKVVLIEFTSDPDNFITCYVDGGNMGEADKISAVEALGWLEKLLLLNNKFKDRASAVGNSRKAWGSKKLKAVANECRERVTKKRENGEKYRNHLWTRRIISFCQRHSAGTIKLINVPDGLLGHPWGWYQFRHDLKYKIEEVGGKIVGTCEDCKNEFELNKISQIVCKPCDAKRKAEKARKRKEEES